jgi:hypothetical protein
MSDEKKDKGINIYFPEPTEATAEEKVMVVKVINNYLSEKNV